MPFYEVIYEDGSHSLANYENDEEAISATQEHHERAERGDKALSSDEVGAVKATRIVRVLRYDENPSDAGAEQTLATDEVNAAMGDLIAKASENDVTHLPTLAAEIRNLSNPLVNSDAHESNYKAEEDTEVELPFLK